MKMGFFICIIPVKVHLVNNFFIIFYQTIILYDRRDKKEGFRYLICIR